jgi:hypothetical protein
MMRGMGNLRQRMSGLFGKLKSRHLASPP